MNIKILDTNVVLDQRLDAIVEEFKNVEEPTMLILPLKVVQEIDRHKKGKETINENAKHATRFLEELRVKQTLNEPIQLSENLSFYVEISDAQVEDFKKIGRTDLDLLLIAEDYQKKGNNVEILCNDTNVRLIGDKIFKHKIKMSPFLEYQQSLHIYSGRTEVFLSDEEIQKLVTEKSLETNEALLPNQMIDIIDSQGTHLTGIYKEEKNRIELLKNTYNAWGVKPYKSKEGIIETQKMAMNCLLDPNIEMMTMVGSSGCGKTYLALAAALEQTLSSKPLYEKIIIMRPMAEADKEIGALPGSKIEKLTPWLAGPIDNLKSLLKKKRPADASPCGSIDEIIEDLINDDILEFESFSFLRGRNLEKTFIIVDDFQNSTKEQANLAVTRAGNGSKIVFLGDISKRQIDNPALTPLNNGLRYLVDHMAGIDPAIAHISFMENEEEIVRSKIVKLAVKYLY